MKVYIVSHKDYIFPSESVYVPIKVGSLVESLGEYAESDSVGDNIAYLNSCFCELTAAYWIWKNSQEKVVGLVHYRRYFGSSNNITKINNKSILSESEISEYMRDYDILVGKPRNYYVTSIKKHYITAHIESDYNLLEREIKENHNIYYDEFVNVMQGTKISLYNMFVGNKAIMDDYFSFLFEVLFSLEQKIDYHSYDTYQKRVFGFMAERLFNVWLLYNKNKYKVKYLPIINIEGENIILKGFGLVKRHLFYIR